MNIEDRSSVLAAPVLFVMIGLSDQGICRRSGVSYGPGILKAIPLSPMQVLLQIFCKFL